MSNAKGLDAEFMRLLKQKNDIVEVLRGYVALDRKGGNYWACCPFHHEKTPSFAVNEGEQFYHCFGCGASGDVVRFVQEIESTDFIGAVRVLAARAKMTVPEGDYDSEEAAKKRKKRDVLVKILRDTARFYLNNLYSGDERADKYLQYIAGRGLSPTTVKKFGLGAALDYNSLPEYLFSKGYTREDLLDSGVVSVNEKGRIYDAQGERLVFPIINAFDEVVAFSGRKLEKVKFGKYKNTSGTMLYDKSKTLYNVNLLKKLKREKPIDEVIFVEGQMDAITLYQAGFQNVVATMGTALTKDQARLAKRYTDKVLISYDGDFAGQKADVRSLDILKEAGLDVRVVPIPEGKDPDELVRESAAAYQKCLDEAMPVIDYRLHALERGYDLNRTEDKRKYVAAALKIVKEAESESVREELLKKLRDKTGITYHALERDLQNVKIAPTQTEEIPLQEKISEVASGSDKKQKALRFILAAKLFSAPYAKTLAVTEMPLSDETHIVIANYIADCETKGERVRPSELFELLDENCPEFNAILDLNYGDKLSGDVAERFFNDSVKTLRLEAVEEEVARCNAEYARATEESKRREIAKKLGELIQKRNAIKKN
ncbi:MAG: DNA primase [Clostridia bacterium]|nr:DNA primase [Clostridia bacterium]MBQ8446841.1 DNA primase [Clostridia bacterium]